ncbi:UDP-N-acetyl glucosamine 2-epimerase [Collibacillus ludicampi]|uniref:UDP-N-acetyl glucosamine 2-epimerase n=1 Tax=Collibacillus ludicampi TaxID=2771369 RepID=A0AAV4LCE7_9BACL|nr:UDP-N-acetylglucosamine 2-epimerase [Collibacillus ludicampi]GIM45490.1 UDP-N-acetyl glucosamine 2-epimerase [Collibacillus ludicampi]
MKRKIAVLTGTRAEFGLLRPIISAILQEPALELCLIVTGMHLLETHGLTVHEIEREGFPIQARVSMYSGIEQEAEYYNALSKGVQAIGDVLRAQEPDILLVLGDRLEPLAAVLAAVTLNIPVAHIHGGERINSGHIDESIRHAISKFAHLHFVATKESAERLKKMGEEDWRIYQVGAPGLDSILHREFIDRETICETLGIQSEEPILLCIQHPVILERERAGEQMEVILRALDRVKMQTVIVYPNNDPGSEQMVDVIERYRDRTWLHIFRNIHHDLYLSLLTHTQVFIGNSSSGIIEAPSFRLPFIHIGTRNLGREHAENVIFVDYDTDAIESAIRFALEDQEFHEKLKTCVNPYGDGQASKRIVQLLKKCSLDKKLLQKQMTY